MPTHRFILIAFFSFLTFGFSVNPLLAQEKTHVVKSGETLSGIARKYKTTIAELNRLNPNAVKGLKAGEALIIAGEAPEKQAPAKISEADGDAKKHTVKSGESLSRIAKKYHVQVKDLEAWNGITSKDLKAGQELIVSGTSGSGSVKTEPKAAIQEKEQPEETTSLGQAVHTVVKGETLSAIAKKEGTTVAELKKLNGLKSNQVNLGQELKVPAKAEPKPELVQSKPELKPRPEPVVKQEPVKKETPSVEPKVAQTPVMPPAEKEKPVAPSVPQPVATEIKEQEKPMNGIREVNNTLGYTRVVETGFAEAIEGDVNSKKHLCLHKTAQIGSILQVKNEVNGQSVFVKVIGKLPDTGSNEKLIIRISRQAYDRLLAVGKRFPVEVSYAEAQ